MPVYESIKHADNVIRVSAASKKSVVFGFVEKIPERLAVETRHVVVQPERVRRAGDVAAVAELLAPGAVRLHALEVRAKRTAANLVQPVELFV